MKANEFKGVIPILPTPFTAEGGIDEASFRRVIDAAIVDGAAALAMFGLASEFAKLADSERARLTEVLVEHAAARVPVIISITHHSLEIAKKEAAEAMRVGADALMILPPFFMNPGPAAVQHHIGAIAQQTDAPIILQYAPIQTGVSLTPESCAALHARHPNLTHVKVDAIPSGPMVSRLSALTNTSLKSIVGYMGLYLPQDVRRGAVAVMPTVSLTRAFAALFASLEKRPDEGRAFHAHLLPLLSFMMRSVELLIATEKILLLRRGLIASDYCRGPRSTLDEFDLAELDELCAALPDLFPESTSLGRTAA